jgi:signal transduction histidine kinase
VSLPESLAGDLGELDLPRLAALARSAAGLASRDDLGSVLTALAGELGKLDDVAGAQVVIAEGNDSLQLMGSAGFAADPEFFGLLAACRERGADLATFRALSADAQIVIPGRRAQMLASDAWSPLHAYLREVDWSDFVATPFPLHSSGTGVINCYMSAGVSVTVDTAAFFRSMGALAGLAIDYHDLMRRDRERVRREERVRLARDLHDSVLQRMFALSMQSKALERAAERLGASGSELAAEAGTFYDTSQSARAELRAIVESERTAPVGETGLADALDRFARQWRSAELQIEITADVRVDRREAAFLEDVYFIVTEAVFNAVRHAHATRISASVVEQKGVSCVVSDDGGGFDPARPGSGFGLTSISQRASRWGGSVTLSSGSHGSRVHIAFPEPRRPNVDGSNP